MVTLKIIFGAITTLILLSSIPLVAAQLTIGEPAAQKSIVVTISEEGDVHVQHEVARSSTVTQLQTIAGTLTNLSVKDVNGDEVDHGTSGLEGISGVTIFPSREDVLIEYELEDVLFLDDGLWQWDFLYLEKTTFILPSQVDLVFINDRPFMLHDAKGVTCHGCDAFLEYVIEDSTLIENFQWEDQNFHVEINTLTEISSLTFSQPAKSISFDVMEDNQFITLVIPLELLWNPYEVFLDDQKILKHEIFSNGTHMWLNFKPETSGTIQIIGTTVVPEFPIIMPLLFGLAAVIALQLKNKINLR